LPSRRETQNAGHHPRQAGEGGRQSGGSCAGSPQGKFMEQVEEEQDGRESC